MITDEEIVRLVRAAIDAREKFNAGYYSINEYELHWAWMAATEDEVVALIRGVTAHEVSLNHN